MKNKEILRYTSNILASASLILLLLIGIMLSINITTNFYRGFHAVDLCHNELLIEEWTKMSLQETRINGETVTLEECYREGLGLILTNYYGFGLIMLLLGMIMGSIYFYMCLGKNEYK